MNDNEREHLIERIKDDMKSRRAIRNALIAIVNDYDLDPSALKPFSTHTGSYTELQMIEMIRDGLAKLDEEKE